MDKSYCQALKDAGQSVTRPRLLVFEALHQSDGPVARAQLAAKLEGQLDRATVYRTIDVFKRLGFVREVPGGWRQLVELGDRFDPHHHHLTCTACGKAVVFEDKGLEAQLVGVARQQGYVLESHQLELTGRCQSCLSR